MNVIQQMAEHTVKQMKETWGGRLPTWEEYREAYAAGRVRANKTIALDAIKMKGIPTIYYILYGLITTTLGFFIFPATVIAWFFARFSAYWILGAAFAAWFLVKVSREGHCEGMKAGAEKHKEFYELLVSRGAFLFGPDR